MSETTKPEAAKHITLPFFHEKETSPFRINEVLPPGTLIIDYEGTRHPFEHGALIVNTHTRQVTLTWSPLKYCTEVRFVWYEPLTITPP